MSSNKDNSAANKLTVKQKKKGKALEVLTVESDSDVSHDSAQSLSGDSQDFGRVSTTSKPTTKKGEWEILEGLKEGQRFEFVPQKFEGYLLKRRKWPMKGWHKRFFFLDQSILTYSKNATDLAKGKKHGSIDIGLSVISTKARRSRIDIDSDSNIYHLKCTSAEHYLQWVEQLKQHRLHKQHQILYTQKLPIKLQDQLSPQEDPPIDTLLSSGISSLPTSLQGTLTRDHKPMSMAAGGSLAGGIPLRTWLIDFSVIDSLGKDIASLHDHINQLSHMIENFDNVSQLGELATPTTKKRGKFRLRKHKANKSTGSATDNRVGLDLVDSAVAPSLHLDCNLLDLRPLSSSNPAISQQSNLSLTSGPSRPHSYSDANAVSVSLTCPPSSTSPPSIALAQPIPFISLDARSLPSETATREDFASKAIQVLTQMSRIIQSLQTEKERMKQVFESESSLHGQSSTAIIATLRNSLNQALQQNAELRSRLARIHEDSNIKDVSGIYLTSGVPHRSLRTSLSYESSSCFSASEYFDADDGAIDICVSNTSSEASSDTSSFTSDASEAHISVAEIEVQNMCFTGRRTRLANPKPPSDDFSPFKFLYNNIGKDLSKVSMPISFNEPLNMLQRLCEELEYCELLDKAANLNDPAERMVQVAAFAVSAYSASIFRAAHKPFNPILGETFECIREDKGFRFIAEQVNHHPPISACHAQSNNFIFWQNLRIKTKFWGRSLEIQPSGSVHLYLPQSNDHYEWNKVTCCIHNLYGGGKRWVDQYGEMVITNRAHKLSCKLSFLKANSWSSKHHEVFGSVMDDEGSVLHNLFGKWTEALYCGHAPSARVVWRPGSMPEDYHLYYGFTRFAIELNELDPESSKYLPPTDTRFRPDQRMLEEGSFAAADAMKSHLEQQQRERRRKREETGIAWTPMWFIKDTATDGEDVWLFGGEYWNKRKDPGFVNVTFEQIF